MPDTNQPGARRPNTSLKSIPRPVVAPDVRNRECGEAAQMAARRAFRDWTAQKMIHATKDGERVFRVELATGAFLHSWSGLRGAEADAALAWLDEHFGHRFYAIALALRSLDADIAGALGNEPLLPQRQEDDPLA